MSLVIENCAGHVHVFSQAGASSGGFYKIEPALPNSKDSKTIITGIPLSFQEIVQPTVTLDDKRALYIFGSAWSEISLTGVLLLGESNSGDKGKILNELLEWYEKNSVSKRLNEPVTVSLSTKAIKAYVVGLRLDAADPNFNKQTFSILMLTPGTK
jgi:hypothetical protein